MFPKLPPEHKTKTGRPRIMYEQVIIVKSMKERETIVKESGKVVRKLNTKFEFRLATEGVTVWGSGANTAADRD